MNEIKFNLQKGDEVQMNGTMIHAEGVEYQVNGGVLEHNSSNELVQVGNKMIVKNDGKITNSVKDGVLKQKDNIMVAESGGVISSEASKSVKGVISQGMKAVSSIANAASSIFGKK